MKLAPEFQRQYEALSAHAGFAPLDRTVLAITGSDRASLLHAFCTADVKRLAPGQGCEAFLTSAQGKALGHVFVLCEPQRLVLDTTAGQATTIAEHLNKFVISEDVEFNDLSGDYQDILVAGPAAESVLRHVLGASPPGNLLEHVAMSFQGHEAVVVRVEYAGPHSFFIRAPASSLAGFIDALAVAGATACEMSVVESVRLEAGFPLFGYDILPDNLPQEVRRDDRAISFTKGCYLGQETVARIDALGHVNRLLVGLRFEGDRLPPQGTSLYSGEKSVGTVTSSAWSPRLASPLAMGYVRRPQAAVGTVLDSEFGVAEVIALPLASGDSTQGKDKGT